MLAKKRFRLRSLILAVSAVAIVLSLAADSFHRHSVLGGLTDGPFFGEPTIAYDGRVERWLGMPSEIIWMDVPIESDIDKLRSFPSLRGVCILAEGMPEECLKTLGTMKNLRELQLPMSIGDEGLQHLTHMTQLEKLELYHNTCFVTDKGLAALHKMDKLKELLIPGSLVSPKGIATLAGYHPELEELDLSGPNDREDQSGFNDNCLKSIARIRSLKSLSLNFRDISDESVKHLSPLTQLRIISLAGTQVTGKEFGQLEAVQKLLAKKKEKEAKKAAAAGAE